MSMIPELYAPTDSRPELHRQAIELPSWSLTPRQLCDLELLMNGGFFPLQGFMEQADYESILATMRLDSGVLFPIPVVLDAPQSFAMKLSIGQKIALRDPEGVILAVLDIGSIWRPDKEREAKATFATDDLLHPGVHYLREYTHDFYIGGKVTGLHPPTHYDFLPRRYTPNELRSSFQQLGWNKVVAFQTRNPLHRAHQELTFQAAREIGGSLLIHPVVGLTKPGDIDHFTRVRCYEAILGQYPPSTTMLALLHLAMRMAGPREALWHGIIRKNYGCSHMIIGRDHAGPGKNSQGNDFYAPYDAQILFDEHQHEIGIKMVPFKQMVYVPEKQKYYQVSDIPEGCSSLDISGTRLRALLQTGQKIPEWFSYPEVIAELRRTMPDKEHQGFTIFFTGLSGAGKSTIANALMIKLMEIGGRKITLLDGDIVRRHLSSELGFSKEHRDINIHRIGYVASEITKNGGAAICAPIAPYAQARKLARNLVEEYGTFIEVYVSTRLEECERRDRKGLYQLARSQKLKEFTGISDPYEEPLQPELRMDTENKTVEECTQEIISKLHKLGLIKAF